MLFSVYCVITAVRVGIGFYCAHKLNHFTKLWVRLIVLSPALSSLVTSYDLLVGERVVTPASVGRALSVVLLYGLIASLFTKNPWIEIPYKGNNK